MDFRTYNSTSGLNQFWWNVISTWWFTSVEPFNSKPNLKGTGLGCMYFSLPNIINTTHNQQTDWFFHPLIINWKYARRSAISNSCMPLYTSLIFLLSLFVASSLILPFKFSCPLLMKHLLVACLILIRLPT